MKWRLKIVPDSAPNADGRWIEVEAPDTARAPNASWRAAALYFTPHVPAGEHLVQYERV